MSRLTTTLLASALMIPSFAFAQDNADEDLIIVTGSPLSTNLDEAITGQSILTGDELQDRLAATIGETLKLEPGLSSTTFGAGASRPIIRGQGGDRVRVLINGVGSIDASAASPDHAVAAEPAQAERIEVVRGASLLRYGSSGSGGIVNVIDGRVPQDFPDGNTDASFRIGASSVDQGFEGAASVDQRAGNFVFHLDGTIKEASDFRIPTEAESEAQLESEGEEIPDDFNDSRRLDNSFSESNGLTGGVSYVGDRGFFGVAVSTFNADYGIPAGHHEEEGEEEGEEEEEEEEEGGVFIEAEQFRVDVNGAWEFDGPFEKVQVFGGYADYEHIEFEGPGEQGTVFANEGFEIRAEAIQAAIGDWRGAYGVQYRERDFSAIGEEAFVPPSETEQFAAFTFHELDLNAFHLEAAARFEHTSQENSVTEFDRSFDLISLSAGGDVHLSDAFRVGGTVFRTERAPTTEELFSDGPHLATNQFEIGNPNFDEETATGAEAAIRYRRGGQNLTLNLFYTDYSDYIFEAETGEIEDGLPVFQFTAEDAEFYGFEVVGETELFDAGSFGISADGLVEFVRAETDTGNLPRIPPLSTLVGLEAESERLTLRGEWEYVSEADDLADFELPTDSHNLINGFLTWKLPVGEDDLAFRFSVLNIFDEEARIHSSFLKDLVPQPGRNFRFSVTARL